MNPVLKIDLPEWVQDYPVQKLMSIIGGDLTPAVSMFVGGCVRNTLLHESVGDIDIATSLQPEEVFGKLQAANIKCIPTGIEHGTLTAVVDGKSFEITTLRHDDETDGRHAKVSFTQSWEEDARRRDFTMNTLLADMSGNIYDPTGAGMDDLNARKVVFVGEPAKRIEEDYLRILRFFRFYAQYGEGEPDKEALRACESAADKITTLSRERITQEFLKILETDKVADVLTAMFDIGVLSDITDSSFNASDLKAFADLQNKHSAVEVISRLFVVSGYRPRFYDDYFRLPHVQQKALIKYDMVMNGDFYKSAKTLKKAIFHHGNDLMLQGYLLMTAKGAIQEDKTLMDILRDWRAPECPITGETLIAEGYKTGPELGVELARRQEEWLDQEISLH
ncbi:MAG TPA: CCA tRNA nucleotidyltransferase [Alphaproteobacteria bacterium]|nr:CCA tRNA nucleotidyltransferase [Alphaproteobacteria bacterium]